MGYCVGSYFEPALGIYRRMPTIEVIVEDKRVKALVNTGCTTSLITPKLAVIWSRKKYVVAVDAMEVGCKGNSTVELTVHGVCLKAEIIVADTLSKASILL